MVKKLLKFSQSLFETILEEDVYSRVQKMTVVVLVLESGKALCFIC